MKVARRRITRLRLALAELSEMRTEIIRNLGPLDPGNYKMVFKIEHLQDLLDNLMINLEVEE